jgi:hypothetical protein
MRGRVKLWLGGSYGRDLYGNFLAPNPVSRKFFWGEQLSFELRTIESQAIADCPLQRGALVLALHLLKSRLRQVRDVWSPALRGTRASWFVNRLAKLPTRAVFAPGVAARFRRSRVASRFRRFRFAF